MAKNRDDGREFRLRPQKPPARGEHRVCASAYRIIMHHARMSGVRRRRVIGFGSARTHTRPYSQRCAVRVFYSKNTSNGQWRAHGRYVARESATHEGDPRAVGFNSSEESIDIAARLEGWQKTNDERVWKLIVSPEFGDRADLKQLTRDLISQMETDLGARLEWVAAAHFNTEHPHVHIALRGVGAEGRPLRLSRTSLGRVSVTSRRICAPGSLGIGRNSMPPMLNVVKYINIATRRLTASSSGMMTEPRPLSPLSSRSTRTQAALGSVQPHR